MRLHALGNLLLIIGFFAPAARAADVPAEFAITGVTYRGSGCPDGSLTYSISEDRKAFTFLFDRFTIETGPNNPSLQTMAGCSIVASTKYPAGWSFAIANVVYRGFAVVEAPLVLWFGRLIVVDSTARGRIPQPVYQDWLERRFRNGVPASIEQPGFFNPVASLLPPYLISIACR